MLARAKSAGAAYRLWRLQRRVDACSGVSVASTGCGDLFDGLDADEQAVVSEALQRDGVDGARLVARLHDSDESAAKQALARFVAAGDVRDGVVDQRAVDLLAQMDDDAAAAMFKVDGRATNFHRWDEWRASLVTANNVEGTRLTTINEYVETIGKVSQRENVEDVAGLVDEVADNPRQLQGAVLETDLVEKYSGNKLEVEVEPIDAIDLAVKQSDGSVKYIEAKNPRKPLSDRKVSELLGDSRKKFTTRAEDAGLEIDSTDERIVTFGAKSTGISDSLGHDRESITETLETMMSRDFPVNSNRPDGLEIDTIRIVMKDETLEFDVDKLYD